MSLKNAKEESSDSQSDDTINLTGSRVESSRMKKLKKFDFVTEDGDHVHLTEEQIKEQKRIEESAKAEASKHEVEYGKYYDKMLNRRAKSRITNCDVLTRKGLITLKVYREDGTSEVIPNFKAIDLHLGEWREFESLRKVQLQFFWYLEDQDHLHFSLCGDIETEDETLARASVQLG
ncbi:hypothetical protein Tco_1312555 [Tanacetum coccineum]